MLLAYQEEVFEKALDQQVRKDVAKACHTVKGKGPATNHSNTHFQRGVTTMRKRNIVTNCLLILALKRII